MTSWDHEFENLAQIQLEAPFGGNILCEQPDNELQQWLDQFSQGPEETVSKKVFNERVSQLEQQLEAVRKDCKENVLKLQKALEDAQTAMM
jgi:hypothetical protein